MIETEATADDVVAEVPSIADELATAFEFFATAAGAELAAQTTPPPHAGIGRSASNSIVVDDPLVSRRHAELRAEPLAVRDLGSQNGTTVVRDDDHIALEPQQWFELAAGDRVVTSHVELFSIGYNN